MNWKDKPAYQNGSTLFHMDSASIAPSRWNWPDECEFESDRFERLKASIDAWGGNLQPIQVRPASVLGVETAAGQAVVEASGRQKIYHEVVFGHARHRACLELGMPVLSMSDRMTDVYAIQQAAMELQGDARWRPWRLGRLLCFALESGLLVGVRRLASTLSIDQVELSVLCELGRLPESVRLAYGNLDLTLPHARKLVKAHSVNRDLVIANSTKQDFRSCKTAAEVLAALKREGS